jgi:hypothetical protein
VDRDALGRLAAIIEVSEELRRTARELIASNREEQARSEQLLSQMRALKAQRQEPEGTASGTPLDPGQITRLTD